MASRSALPLEGHCLDRLGHGRGMNQARLLLDVKDVTMALPLCAEWLDALRSWQLLSITIISRCFGPSLRWAILRSLAWYRVHQRTIYSIYSDAFSFVRSYRRSVPHNPQMIGAQGVWGACLRGGTQTRGSLCKALISPPSLNLSQPKRINPRID